MPDVDDINQYRREVLKRSKATKNTLAAARKLALKFPDSHTLIYKKRLYESDKPDLEKTSDIGTLMELLAPEDAEAFPPDVLKIPVVRDTAKFNQIAPDAVGLYNPIEKIIRMFPAVSLHEFTRGTTHNPPLDLYRTLLHEAGHARGFGNVANLENPSIFQSEKKMRRLFSERDYLRGEEYAYALVDSLMRARGLK